MEYFANMPRNGFPFAVIVGRQIDVVHVVLGNDSAHFCDMFSLAFNFSIGNILLEKIGGIVGCTSRQFVKGKLFQIAIVFAEMPHGGNTLELIGTQVGFNLFAFGG